MTDWQFYDGGPNRRGGIQRLLDGVAPQPPDLAAVRATATTRGEVFTYLWREKWILESRRARRFGHLRRRILEQQLDPPTS